MNAHVLAGCRPEPLASYLKALGVLRLLTAKDPTARGHWHQDEFVVTTVLGEDELLSFFAEEYAPTPILAAWNGAGGLFKRPTKVDKVIVGYNNQTKNTKATDALAASTAARLAPIRGFIALARNVVSAMGLVKKPDPKDEKPELLRRLRDAAPDDVVLWLDAAFVITNEQIRYPPLLGCGGVDGALDFGNKFQQHLAHIMSLANGRPSTISYACLRASLLGCPEPTLVKDKPGQFDPGRAEGPNSGAGFSGAELVNPWDFILFMEGSLTLAAASTKQMEHAQPGVLAYPFAVRVSGAGNGGLALADEKSTRHEVWLPLWPAPARFSEIERLFGEGRATVGRRAAATAVDFARAVGTLGVDRGVRSFVRFGFLERNGQANIAVALGRWRAERRPELSLIDTVLDKWLNSLRRASGGSIGLGAAYRRVSDAVMALSQARDQAPEDVQRLLVELARVDLVVARSKGLRESLQPVPTLGSDWAVRARDGSAEFRLARSLASTNIRRRIVSRDGKWGWGEPNDPGVVWQEAGLEQNLLSVVQRELVEFVRDEVDETPRWPAAQEDVQAFVRGELDETRLEELILGLSLVGRLPKRTPTPRQQPRPVDPLWALAALAWDQRKPSQEAGLAARRTPAVVTAGLRGDSRAMSRAAIERLRPGALRHRPLLFKEPVELHGLGVGEQVATPEHARRCAAALAFPLGVGTLETLTETVFQTAAAVEESP